MQKRGFTFLCDVITEKECLDRQLVGGKDNYLKEGAVKRGDQIVLYNINTGILHGIFVATTDSQKNIEPEAWEGGFPLQVKVTWDYQYEPLHRLDVERILRFHGNMPNKVLTLELLLQLEERFKNPERSDKSLIEYSLENPATLLTEDGHKVRSEAERTIDNWLYKRNICHAYEKPLPSGGGHCDFYIPSTHEYIEYWGLTNKDYTERKEYKKSLYKANQLKLIEIEHKDIPNLGILFDKLKR